jgi:glycogen debranching enzyme
VVLANGEYVHQPDWYRNFLYTQERARGLDHTEDLASPGIFRWDLSSGEAVWLLTAAGHAAAALPPGVPALACLQKLRTAERQRRRAFCHGVGRGPHSGPASLACTRRRMPIWSSAVQAKP